jgi:F-type H+-transporting ATPase subunit b
MELLKLLSANELVAQIVSFLILLFLLRKFAWDKILKVLDERKARIANELKVIEEEKQNAAKIKAEYEAKMRLVDAQVRKLITAAEESGRKITEEIRQKAREEAHNIVENARVEIQFEIDKAKGKLKDELVDIVIKATEEMIEEKLTEEQDRRIVDNFLQKIDTLGDKP